MYKIPYKNSRGLDKSFSIEISQKQIKDLETLLKPIKKDKKDENYWNGVAVLTKLFEPALSRDLAGLSDEKYKETMEKNGTVPLPESAYDIANKLAKQFIDGGKSLSDYQVDEKKQDEEG